MSNKDNNTPPSIPTSKSSLCIVPEEKSSSEEHLISNNNSKKVLLVMAIGLRDKDGNVISGDFSSNVYPSKHKSKWKPLAADILQEIKRRKVLFGGKAKVNSQMKLSDCCSVTQMLDASVGIDTASAPNSNKKHKKSDDDGRLEKLSASIDNANKIAAETNKIAAETLTLSKKKLEQDEVHKLMDIIANLKVQLMTAEEKLIMQNNKSSPLAKFYLEKVNALKKEILERENYLTSVKGIECR